MGVLADHDVIVDGDAERLRHGDDLLRHLDIGARRRRVAGRMIVDQNNRVPRCCTCSRHLMAFSTDADVRFHVSYRGQRRDGPVPLERSNAQCTAAT